MRTPMSAVAASFVGLVSGQVRLSTEWLAPQRAYIGAVLVDGFDPAALASRLEGTGMRYQGESVALDHPWRLQP